MGRLGLAKRRELGEGFTTLGPKVRRRKKPFGHANTIALKIL